MRQGCSRKVEIRAIVFSCLDRDLEAAAVDRANICRVLQL
jgi:hypothetical protein